MSDPSNNPSPQGSSFVTLAARCRDLAEKAAKPEDRLRWLEMERFWSRRAAGVTEAEQIVEL